MGEALGGATGSQRRGRGKKSSKGKRLADLCTREAQGKEGEGAKDPMPFLTSSGVRSHLFIPCNSLFSG